MVHHKTVCCRKMLIFLKLLLHEQRKQRKRPGVFTRSRNYNNQNALQTSPNWRKTGCDDDDEVTASLSVQRQNAVVQTWTVLEHSGWVTHCGLASSLPRLHCRSDLSPTQTDWIATAVTETLAAGAPVHSGYSQPINYIVKGQIHHLKTEKINQLWESSCRNMSLILTGITAD